MNVTNGNRWTFHHAIGKRLALSARYGYTTHMLKKKQMRVKARDEGRTAAKQFYALAA